MAERITTPFGFGSTALEVIAGVDLSGKRTIVTGGASGIGIETARALASAGAEVILAVRNVKAGEAIAAEITDASGNQDVRVSPLNLAEPMSIREFLAGWQGPLDILVNNAGVMATPLTRTREGWEIQFATNHLGHLAFAIGLRDALAKAGNARIVSLSSRAHLRSPVIFDDINFNDRPYDPWLAYGQSKTANVLFAVEATRRWRGDAIAANAVHPGAIIATNLSRHMDPKALEDIIASGAYNFKTPEQGAATSILVATSPLVDGVGGRYFEDCNESEVLSPGAVEGASSGVAPYALDPEAAARLWDVSEQMLLQ